MPVHTLTSCWVCLCFSGRSGRYGCRRLWVHPTCCTTLCPTALSTWPSSYTVTLSGSVRVREGRAFCLFIPQYQGWRGWVAELHCLCVCMSVCLNHLHMLWPCVVLFGWGRAEHSAFLYTQQQRVGVLGGGLGTGIAMSLCLSHLYMPWPCLVLFGWGRAEHCVFLYPGTKGWGGRGY